MPLAMNLEGEVCRECGEEELYWWVKDETESIVEVYMNCDRDDGCGFEYSKLVVNKSEDTSDSALKKQLVEKRL